MPEPTDDSQLITKLPLTAEAHENLLDELFMDELPHRGELYVPGNAFYVRGSGHKQATHMLKSLCVWLGIKPGYIALEFESDTSTMTQGQRHTIFIETRVVHDELLLGATLAHALTRYLLEERKRVYLADPYDQLALIATATVVFGLGIVVSNGVRTSRAYHSDQKELLGTLPLSEYGIMLHGFLWQRAVPVQAYENNLTPWTAELLQVPKSKKPIPVVRQQYHRRLQKRFEWAALAWLSFLSIAIIGFLLIQIARSNTGEAKYLRDKITLLQELKQACNDSVAYTKQYADTSDLQTLRSLNSDESRCKSLDNQLLHVEQEYEDTQ